MLDLGTNARLELLDLLFQPPQFGVWQCPMLARAQGDMPGHRGIPLLDPLVAGIAKDSRLCRQQNNY